LKTKLLLVAAAAIISAGVYMHSGNKPRCLLHLFASEKPAVKAQPSITGLTNMANGPKEKK
jgi:hypothetical protein